MVKNLLQLVLAIITAIGLVSCASKAPPMVSVLPPEPARIAISMPDLPTGEAQCLSEPNASDANKTDIVWMAPSIWPDLATVVTAFETQYPQIHVELYPVDPENYFETSRQYLAGGCETPDLLNIKVELSAYYAAYQWLAPFWNEFTFDQKEDWIQALRKSGRYAQEQYSVPFSTSTSLIFYNQELFTQSGVKPPGEKERWTWEKVIKAAQKLTRDENQDSTPETWGFAWEANTIQQLIPLAESLGGSAIDPDGMTVAGVIDSQPWLDAFTFYGKVFNEWKAAPKDEAFQSVDAFMAGRLAMLVGSAELIDRFNKVDFSWGVARYPYFEKGKVVIPTGDWQLGVNAKSAHQEAAMTLVTWLATRPGGETLWRTGNIALPAEKTVLGLFATAAELAAPPDSFWKLAASEALVFTLPGPVTPFHPAYEKCLQEAIQKIRAGANPQAALSEAIQKLATEMK
jgi:fructooligosaccharide transport system substrate-binding protein